MQPGELSPDRQWRWDGARWVPHAPTGAPQPGELSPDLLWRWDGARWAPAATSPAPPPGLPALKGPARSGRSWAATAGGAVAILGAALVIVASAIPYIRYTDVALAQTPTPSVFNTGFGPSNWFAVEPAGAALAALGAGVLLIVWMSRIPRAVASGILVGLGAQTLLLFLGYFFFAVTSPDSQLQPGGVVGILSGLLLISGGIAGLVTSSTRSPASTHDQLLGMPR